MVRTRSGVVDVAPSREYRRIAIKGEQVDDSEESDYLPVSRKRRKIHDVAKERERSRSTSKNSFTNALGELVSGSGRPIRHQRKLAIIDDDGDAMDAKGGEASLMSNGDDSGIRRSTRQRKSTYDSLNQTWLLSCAQMRDYPIYVDVEVPSGASGSQKPKKDTEDELSSRSGADFEDMYSRVKRARSKTKHNFYALDGGNDRSDGSCAEGGDDGDVDADVGDGSVSNMEGSCQLAAEGSEVGTHDEDSRGTKYYLRQKKPIIDRFQVAIEPQRQRKPPDCLDPFSPRRLRSGNFRASFRSPVAHRSPHHARRRHATHNSSASSSSSCSSSSEEDRDERRFERRKSKSMARARNMCLPMNLTSKDVAASSVLRDRKKIGTSLADVDPMGVDRTATFESVGGHDRHVQSLKEMLLLPLMYPEVFEKFKITPPRGVLFYGPPGTGKTLVARALANECSQGERKVAFFMRKGADCLSKWVGESERQLRLLFDQAYSMRPSIIFFDEIDGLAPVRSSRQDQIHSSIVSTLLALMDGLDGRGEVVVVGATNRIDAIDPALRRPGRFDREFNFALPSVESRLTILRIHTKDWIPPLNESFLGELADKTVGFCGADLKALCAESAFLALRRRYPQIYQSRQKLQLDISSIKIEARDFYRALDALVPASQRSAAAPGRPLNPVVRPLLLATLNRVLDALKTTFPQGFAARTSSGIVQQNDFADDPSSDEDNSDVTTADVTPAFHSSLPNGVALNVAAGVSRPMPRSSRDSLLYLPSHRPRMLLVGSKGQGQSTHIGPAVLHHLERFPTHKLDLPALFAVTAKAPEESCSQIFLEAQRNLPAILYLPHVGQWWDTLTDTVRATFLTLLTDLETTSPLLLLATSDGPFDNLSPEIQELFDQHQGEVLKMANPTKAERWQFFSDLILYETKRKPKNRKRITRKTESLPLAPPPPPRVLSQKEARKLREEEEGTLTELRLFLRDILYKLARDRRFSIFAKPVDTSEVTDYLQVIREPMDLETMMSKIDLHKYETVADFLEDVNLICQNALEYNPDREPSDKIIRHRACALRDAAHSLVFTDLDPEFEQTCLGIREARKERGDSPNKCVPSYYDTHPRLPKIEKGEAVHVKNNATKDQEFKEGTAPATDNCDMPEAKLTEEISLSKAISQRVKRPEKQRVVDSCVQKVAEAKDGSIAVAFSARGSTVKPRTRRRPNIWFGQSKRIRRVARVESCSEDSHDNGTGAKAKHHLVNGAGPSGVKVIKDECDTPMLHISLSPIQNGNEVASSEVFHTSYGTDPLTLSPCFNQPAKKSTNDSCANASFDSDISVTVSITSLESKTSSLSTSEFENPNVNELELSNEVAQTDENDTTITNTAAVEIDNSDDARSVKDAVQGKENEPIDEEQEREANRTVSVDQARLRHLLDKVVAITECADIEILQKLHCRLHQIVRSNRQEWDKTALLNDMDKEVVHFNSTPMPAEISTVRD